MNVVCIKYGDKYGAEYVNKLQSMLKRHLTIPHKLICLTDDLNGVECETRELEENLEGWWPKLTLFREKPYGLTEKFLYLDLDIVIVDNIDAIAGHPADFVIMEDGGLPMYNSSVMLIEPGSQAQVWEKFEANREHEMKTSRCGDQWIITKYAENALTWPEPWCVSFRRQASARVPKGAKMVIFHGEPNPHQYPAEWVSTHWR